jgi:hypothetical protein
LDSKPRHRVSWTEDTVDNEGMNKKKSNRNCAFIQYVAYTIVQAKRAVILAVVMMRETLWKEIDTRNIFIKQNALNLKRKIKSKSPLSQQKNSLMNVNYLDIRKIGLNTNYFVRNK